MAKFRNDEMQCGVGQILVAVTERRTTRNHEPETQRREGREMTLTRERKRKTTVFFEVLLFNTNTNTWAGLGKERS